MPCFAPLVFICACFCIQNSTKFLSPSYQPLCNNANDIHLLIRLNRSNTSIDVLFLNFSSLQIFIVDVLNFSYFIYDGIVHSARNWRHFLNKKSLFYYIMSRKMSDEMRKTCAEKCFFFTRCALCHFEKQNFHLFIRIVNEFFMGIMAGI